MSLSSKIIWLTGMSGTGKTFYANYISKLIDKKKYKINFVDGDAVRDKYDMPMSFSYEDICKNNLTIAKICKNNLDKYDMTLVSVISPYEHVRMKIKQMFGKSLFFIYVFASLESLKKRDTKKLYSMAEKGSITNLIGYSKGSKYEKPVKADLSLDTSDNISPEINFNKIKKFLEIHFNIYNYKV